jgi:uncharacterized membrane protein YdjX (TVP38/TMEM64 family)
VVLKRISGWLVAGALAVSLVVAWPFIGPMMQGGTQYAASLLERAGHWGPLVVILLQILQAVLSPLPSWPVTVAAGALYGPAAGTLYSLIGGLLGSSLNFWLARRHGAWLIKRTLGPGWLERAGRLTPYHFLLLSAAGRLVPVLSVDIVAYLAGISRIRFETFLLVSLVGQAPAFFAYAFCGSELSLSHTISFCTGLIVVLFLSVVLGGRRLLERLAI